MELPDPGAVSRRLRPIAANRHAAPTPCVTLAHVEEPQRASRTLAFPDEGEVLFAHEVADRLGNREEQGLGPVPAAPGLPLQRPLPVALGLAPVTGIGELDLPVGLVSLEQCVQRRQVAQGRTSEGLPGMIADERAEPFAQLPRL